MNLKTLCVAFFLMTMPALVQDQWENYKPRTLNQIIEQHAPEVAKAHGEKVALIISADQLDCLIPH